MVDRPKQGFDVPIGSWLRGPLRGWASDLFEQARLDRDGITDPAAIEADWREHLSGRQDNSRELWSVLMFQAWREQSVNPRLTAAETPSVHSELTEV
jgi:asparagine synthase (glutamine-hydrolysing)